MKSLAHSIVAYYSFNDKITVLIPVVQHEADNKQCK